MKAQRAWWQTLSPADKKKELELESIARGLEMSIEEARHRVERDNA